MREMETVWHGAKWREAEPPVVVQPRYHEAASIADRIVALMADGQARTQSQIRDRVHAGSDKVKDALHRLAKRGAVVTERGNVGQTLYRVAR